MRSDFAIKGQRDYLSGSIVLDFILAKLAHDPRDLDMVFFKKTLNNCLFQTEAPSDQGALVGRYRDRERLIHVVETPEAITRRIPYPEEQVVQACIFDGPRASVPAAVEGFSFTEKLVAAYKHLLHARFPQHKGRLIFVQLKLARIPAGAFEIEFERRLGNDFYQAAVLESGTRLGRVFFGEWA